ncbi:hypothetical protein A6A04_12150 [Paramagnetospirillum marisnigri]|uniref:protein O-GlcNAc transferase n=2 Tax=Paramagnetospirillum marisnigri TaxID=1285242 RepID=A0A178MY41_9PROT|nr:hypothetical protein A6A04_12150 [Paramagnetospirillum marisnigri]
MAPANCPINLGIAYLAAGQDAAALGVLENVARALDTDVVLWLALALARRRTGEARGAASAVWSAFVLVPDDPDVAHLLLGELSLLLWGARAAMADGQIDRAEALLDHILLLNPADAAAMHDYGVVAYRRGNLECAVELFERALARRQTASGLCNLGAALADLGRRAAALAAYRRCMEAFPTHAPAYYNAACALAELGRLDEAESSYRRALEVNPDYADACNNLGHIVADLGRPAEAVAFFRRAVEIHPGYAKANSNLLFNLYYLPEVSGEEIAEESRKWGERHAPLAVVPPRHANDRDPERMLRVGYLSPDLRDHAANYFLEPVLEGHDRNRYAVFCYALGGIRDAVSERLRGLDLTWREVEHLDDAALAEQIRIDGIDILVDCAGHSRGNRLSMFSLEPAPVQLGNHLGMAGTLGVPAIRHFITDRHIAPEGTDAFFTESVVRLPGPFMPFRARADWPEVPPREDGPPVFACFAEPLRYSAPVLAAWGRMLDAVPGSRLLLKHPRFGNRQALAHYRRSLASLGKRVDFEDVGGGWNLHWPVYGRVSVILDSFPVTGATSTVIPLWMGVPVVSLAGHHPGQRFGVSMLSNANLSELVATTMDDYVRIAVELASNRAKLQRYRKTLRQILSCSPLMDEPGGVANLELAYRSLWQRWCGTRKDS